jgi:diacylglycerol kinase (ATP)
MVPATLHDCGALLRWTAGGRLSPHELFLLPSSAHMRAAAIFGLGCSQKAFRPFKVDANIDWGIGMPLASDEAEVILIFGGDGTIHRHLSQLVRLGLPVLVVPAGSGNDFARALGLHRVRDSLAAWRGFCQGQGNLRAIDLGVVTPLEDAGGAPSTIAQGRPAPHESPRYFCCVAGVGLDGEVSRRANALPRWLRGHGGYALTLVPTILQFAPVPVKISITGESAGWKIRSDQPTILATFANTPTYGGGMKIAPHAKLDDGVLDVCVIGGMSPFKLFCLFPTVYSGGHLQIREVGHFQSSRLRIDTERPLDVYADGEYVCQTPVEVTVQHRAVRVIVHPSQTSF